MNPLVEEKKKTRFLDELLAFCEDKDDLLMRLIRIYLEVEKEDEKRR